MASVNGKQMPATAATASTASAICLPVFCCAMLRCVLQAKIGGLLEEKYKSGGGVYKDFINKRRPKKARVTSNQHLGHVNFSPIRVFHFFCYALKLCPVVDENVEHAKLVVSFDDHVLPALENHDHPVAEVLAGVVSKVILEIFSKNNVWLVCRYNPIRFWKPYRIQAKAKHHSVLKFQF